ncbi:hypothetical protein BABINDRAFT_163466 [Babjeviella inositovora NRRL Y-12698]|uniref:K Homology domain-containing protein n=1 Tax=Babjeviella inositovora NRRL Y-12698 TaxID=984486 RepID=A0A1E3QIB7_9ASCO|nr:uncharacterized protein BABINDRAFT_163466 [Babjeviella inositovora NRRL Y-12698]ODQ77445.1 hypothetical protein BABINDRAFT_163466 [Babjeviella inositovora NRRL Y-12698]
MSFVRSSFIHIGLKRCLVARSVSVRLPAFSRIVRFNSTVSKSVDIPGQLIKPVLGFNRSLLAEIENDTQTTIELDEGSSSCVISGGDAERAAQLIETIVASLTTVKQFPLKSRLVLPLAGVQGSTLKRIQDETATVIVFDTQKNRKTLDKTCYIYSDSEANCEAAFKLVQERVANLQATAVKMEIPHELMMPLVGLDGMDIKQIEGDTQCWFDNTRDRSAIDASLRICYIYSDSPAGVPAMQEWINARLASLSAHNEEFRLPMKDFAYVGNEFLESLESSHPGAKILSDGSLRNMRTDRGLPTPKLTIKIFGTDADQISEIKRAIQDRIDNLKRNSLSITCSKSKFNVLVGHKWARTTPFAQQGVKFVRYNDKSGAALRIFADDMDKAREAYECIRLAFNSLAEGKVTIPARLITFMQKRQAGIEAKHEVMITDQIFSQSGDLKWMIHADPEVLAEVQALIKQQIQQLNENTKFAVVPTKVADKLTDEHVNGLQAEFSGLLFMPYQAEVDGDKYIFVVGEDPAVVEEAVVRAQEVIDKL